MNTIKTLKASLDGFDTQQQLDALRDGAFLSNFIVTQDEVEELYNDLMKASTKGTDNDDQSTYSKRTGKKH